MKILIVSLRYLGDCFLSAALAGPIKAKYPDAYVDVLTYKGNEKIIEGCNDIDHVLTIEANLKARAFFRRFFSRHHDYDWVLITQESSRAVMAGFWLAKSAVKEKTPSDHRSWWKNLLVSHLCERRSGHFLDRQSILLKPIVGFEPKLDPLNPAYDQRLDHDIEIFCRHPYVVCHLHSRYEDKNWSEKEWLYLIRKMQQKGLSVLLTGGNGAAEKETLEALVKEVSNEEIKSVAGRLTFAQSAYLISKAKLFIGVDTATSHIAAATGIQTVSLFGPTDVCVWGPSPVTDRKPYNSGQCIQRNGNVTVIRNPAYLNCRKCHRHRCGLNKSEPEKALCLQTLSGQWLWSCLEGLEII